MKKRFNEASEVDSYNELRSEDKKKVDAAWVAGYVNPEDVPESAKKPDTEDKGEKQKAGDKRKTNVDVDTSQHKRGLHDVV